MQNKYKKFFITNILTIFNLNFEFLTIVRIWRIHCLRHITGSAIYAMKIELKTENLKFNIIIKNVMIFMLKHIIEKFEFISALHLLWIRFKFKLWNRKVNERTNYFDNKYENCKHPHVKNFFVSQFQCIGQRPA